MKPNQRLLGERIVLTGTSITKKAQSKIEALGGQAIHLPLIEVAEIQSTEDEQLLQQSQNKDWLIFTSQNAVHAFANKLQKYHLSSDQWRTKIAAVGSKTAEALEELGFSIHFMPTTFSADCMVIEFNEILHTSDQCMFMKGSMAKDTLKDGLHCHLAIWTIYETVICTRYVEEMKTLLSNERCTVVFASPSAVDTFAQYILPSINWNTLQVAAIGHITEARLSEYGARNIIQPSVYTMESVIDEIAIRKEQEQ
ncbi:MAG TPA: uroporphyrinogen-III synthase [Kurthia sp.]